MRTWPAGPLFIPFGLPQNAMMSFAICYVCRAIWLLSGVPQLLTCPILTTCPMHPTFTTSLHRVLGVPDKLAPRPAGWRHRQDLVFCIRDGHLEPMGHVGALPRTRHTHHETYCTK